jgi:hypothetical protein
MSLMECPAELDLDPTAPQTTREYPFHSPAEFWNRLISITDYRFAISPPSDELSFALMASEAAVLPGNGAEPDTAEQMVQRAEIQDALNDDQLRIIAERAD